MIPGPCAAPFARLVLCLGLLAASAGLAQDSKAADAPVQEAPRGEVIPHEQEQKDDAWSGARLAGRLILQPPAGIVVGGAAGLVMAFPSALAYLFLCGPGLSRAEDNRCFNTILYPVLAVSMAVGAGIGVTGVGYLLGGRARIGAVFGGAVAGSAVGGAIVLLSGSKNLDTLSILSLLLVGPALGATVAYALSDAFFPDHNRTVAPAPKDNPEDEYVQLLPMVSTTRTGGFVGGLVGRF